MSDMNLDELTAKYVDVLREIGNIGAGNAMTALAQMVQHKIDMKVPQVKLLEFSELGELVGGEEVPMVGVILGVEGDITGNIMFLIELGAAKNLVKSIMMGYESGREDFDEMELSAMQEVSNIITGAYLNSLASLTNMMIYPTPPCLTIDMAGAILSVPATKFGVMGDKILMIQSQFFDEVQIDGYFILIPDIESYERILESLGIM